MTSGVSITRDATAVQHQPTLVLTSAVPWDGIFARAQHVATGLAKQGWDVLYVDGPLTWLSPLKNRDLAGRLVPRTPVRTIPLHSVSDGQPASTGGLRVLSPLAQIPFGNVSRRINRFNQRMLALQIRAAVPGPCILLSMLPASVDLLPFLHPVASLYDCVDLHSEFKGFIKKEVVDQMEQDMASVSRVVFATAETLRARMARWHADVRILPNAAEIDHFAATADAPVHPLLQDIPSPRITMIGGIGSWIDQGFLCQLAEAMPEAHIVLIGPIETDVSALEQHANIHLLGRQPYTELPQFLAGSDATLVAFRVDDPVAQSVNPVKGYEYIAAGKEVVATPIPEMQKLGDVLWLAETGAQAAAVIRRILAGERRVTDAAARAEFVANNSWAARVAEIDRVLRSIVPHTATAPEQRDVS
ncbi:glycosyltransferase [Alicyclobacillus cycloheptanicus]|uniref:Spore protein YkvP/CgeB glycosyl transferase-like domain-containing protein n=1 Tax=Alicyclobacillus cycloheptanicus TaxID=1457 RepID=A0ABT9XI65_9BACL|nr:glycosyltransferase [Alicyclobacillus cycloheptanicus]MDQ0190002.1 hypothetical protein [Alicyclobacillus cycloheptanicus]WDM00091.1 glycosyltransferase [Alicyclobacillus cycloheptanicus]